MEQLEIKLIEEGIVSRTFISFSIEPW